MSIRTSTSGLNERMLAHMQTLQNRLARTQDQLGTGLKLNTAKDNPVAAGAAVALDRAEAGYLRFGSNADVLLSRLTAQEGTLANVNEILVRLRELAVQGNSSTLNENGRAALLPEVATLQQALLAAANTMDAEGRCLFGGTRDNSKPFVLQNGQVGYLGDQSQRQIEVAPGTTVADTDPGSELFMRIRTGNGMVATRTDAANSGSGVLTASGFTDQRQWDGGSYRVTFNAGSWQATDAASTVIAAGAYVPGQSISFRGYQLSITGQPADGDNFTVAPAPAQDVFSLVDRLEDALQTPETGSANAALRQNRFYAVIEDLAGAADHLIDARAATGARLNALDLARDEREGALLNTRATLSQLRDLDYAEAISRLSRETAALEAAQQTFTRVQSLSLFSLLR